MTKKKQSYDTPWKEIIEFFFPQFMTFFVPGSEEDIDWGTDFKFLDKEFRSLTKESVIGQKHTDKLVEVTLKNNSKKWILIHIEVQAQNQLDFPERMFVYNYRIYDRFKIPVTSVAILADDSATWRPGPFRYGMWGSTMGLDYLTTKLLDYKEKWAYLKRQDNPFAIVVMAHLKALETRKDHSLRKQWKIELTRLLYEKGYSKAAIINLYRFIDWVLTLPEALEEIFVEELKTYEKEKNMPYITNAERIGRKKGKQEGRQEGRQETVIELVRKAGKKGMSEEMIAQFVDLDVNLVKQILNNEPVEIPLHLLADR
jgi:predicted transposase/invertase (TIGR01784 family)